MEKIKIRHMANGGTYSSYDLAVMNAFNQMAEYINPMIDEIEERLKKLEEEKK